MVGREGFEPPKAFRQLIYSQPPLAAWVPPRTCLAFSALVFYHMNRQHTFRAVLAQTGDDLLREHVKGV